MIQCKDCELCIDGQLTCVATENIKEAECLLKWQIVALLKMKEKIEVLCRIVPRQEKLLDYTEREIAERAKVDSWKHNSLGDDDGS